MYIRRFHGCISSNNEPVRCTLKCRDLCRSSAATGDDNEQNKISIKSQSVYTKASILLLLLLFAYKFTTTATTSRNGDGVVVRKRFAIY